MPANKSGEFRLVGQLTFDGIILSLSGHCTAEDKQTSMLRACHILDQQFHSDDIPRSLYEEVDSHWMYTITLV